MEEKKMVYLKEAVRITNLPASILRKAADAGVIRSFRLSPSSKRQFLREDLKNIVNEIMN